MNSRLCLKLETSCNLSTPVPITHQHPHPSLQHPLQFKVLHTNCKYFPNYFEHVIDKTNHKPYQIFSELSLYYFKRVEKHFKLKASSRFSYSKFDINYETTRPLPYTGLTIKRHRRKRVTSLTGYLFGNDCRA